MTSKAIKTFGHAIQDATDLLNHFDNLNTKPPPPDIEVLKRASLVLALTALETYFEDRLAEAVELISDRQNSEPILARFFKSSLTNDLKVFHTPSTDRVRPIFQKYLEIDITEGWSWNYCDPELARRTLNKLAKKRGDIAHRSRRPLSGEPIPKPHAVTRDSLRKHIHFIEQLAQATDSFLDEKL